MTGHLHGRARVQGGPGKSAHQAVQSARKAVASGLRWVVDIDLAKFFDRVRNRTYGGVGGRRE